MSIEFSSVLSSVFSPEDLETVISALKERRNIAIFGATRTGKTTLLTSLLEKVDPKLTLRIRDTKGEVLDIRTKLPHRNVLIVGEDDLIFTKGVWKKLDGDMLLTVIEDAFTYQEDRTFIEQANTFGLSTLIVTVNSFLESPSVEDRSDLAKVMLQSISDFVTIQCTYTRETGFKAKVVS